LASADQFWRLSDILWTFLGLDDVRPRAVRPTLAVSTEPRQQPGTDGTSSDS
jgi:hypothetical protein